MGSKRLFEDVIILSEILNIIAPPVLQLGDLRRKKSSIFFAQLRNWSPSPHTSPPDPLNTFKEALDNHIELNQNVTH